MIVGCGFKKNLYKSYSYKSCITNFQSTVLCITFKVCALEIENFLEQNKMELPVPVELKQSLYVPNKTLMGPGPSNCTQRVLDSLSNPVLGHMHPECFEVCIHIFA